MTLWTPARLGSKVKLWLDASVGVTESSGAVSQWDDQSPSGITATQGTGSLQPTYSATSFNSSYPGITAAGDEMTLSACPFTNTATLFSISTVDSAATNYSPGTGGSYPSSGYPGLSTPCIVACTAGADIRHWRDGTLYADSVTDGGAISVPVANPASFFAAVTFNSGGSTFGRYIENTRIFTRAASDRDLNATIAEMICCDQELTEGEKELIEGYLAHKYGLEGNLPSTHPYKASAPTDDVLWRPQFLTKAPVYVYDATNASDSGTRVSIPNTGLVFGTVTETSDDQMTIGTLNSADVVTSNGNNNLSYGAVRAYTGPISAFGLFSTATQASSYNCILGLGQWTGTGTSGFGWYVNTDGSDSYYGTVADKDDIVVHNGYTLADAGHTRFSVSPGSNEDGNLALYAWRIGSAGGAYRVNGVAKTLANTDYPADDSGNDYNTVGHRLFANGTGTETVSASIAIIGVIHDHVSDSDLEKLEGWMAWDKGLESLLPTGHPYKTQAPQYTNNATLAATLANQTVSGAGVLTTIGSAAITNQNQTVASAGTITILATSTTTNQNQTLASAGDVSNGLDGGGDMFNQNQTATGAGVLTTIGSGAVTNQNQTSTGEGTSTIVGAGAATVPNQTVTGFGVHTMLATLAVNNQNQTVTGTGVTDDGIYASSSATLPNQTASGNGTVDASVNGTCAATLPNQTCSGAVDNGVSAGLDPWIEGVGVATHPYANQKQYWPRYLSKKAEAKYNYHQNAPFNPDMPSV